MTKYVFICSYIYIEYFFFHFLLQLEREGLQMITSLSFDWALGPRCQGVPMWCRHGSYEQSMSMRLTSSISMCMLGEAVDNGVDCFLEDGLGPRVGHRTRHWPTARGNGGCGLRLRPRHVRRHADTTHSMSIQGKHTAHQHTNYYPVNGTNTRETH